MTSPDPNATNLSPSAALDLDAFIAQLKAHDAAATKGPWHVRPDPGTTCSECGAIAVQDKHLVCWQDAAHGPGIANIITDDREDGNAALIAFARNSLPRMVEIAEELKRARRENVCDACVGTGEPISGGLCMCRGTGKMSEAATYLREQLVKTEQELERVRAELVDLKSVRQVELAHVAQSAQEAFEEADERAKGYEAWAEELSADLGCKAEWSNLHDHFQCIRGAALNLASHYESAEKTIPALMAERDTAKAEAAKLRESLEEIRDRRGVLCTNECRTSQAMVEIASAALTPTPGDGQ